MDWGKEKCYAAAVIFPFDLKKCITSGSILKRAKKETKSFPAL